MTKSKVYINEAPFTADDATIDQVLTALFNTGWRYCNSTQGWCDPEYVARERKSGHDTFSAVLEDCV